LNAEADPKPTGSPDDDLRRRLDVARAGGDPRYHAKLREQGKLFVRDRIERIMDPGWSFEDGLLARHVDGNLPADGVVTVVGQIGGRPVCVIANDMTVKAGTWGLRTFQKMTAMQELAGRTKSALVYLVDSAGARIDEQRSSYAGRKAWGNIFYNGDVSGINTGTRTFDQWFNTSGFERTPSKQPAAFQARVFPQRVDGVRADGLNRLDANIQRTFKIKEGISFQLKMDALNAANRSQMDVPNLDPTSTNFGKITSNTSSTMRYLLIQGRVRF